MKGLIITCLALAFATKVYSQPRPLYPILHEYCKELYPDYETISEDRRFRLEAVADYIKEKKEGGEVPEVLFVGTNQSTRSIMTQAWAYAAAYYYGVDGVEFYSGGLRDDPIPANTITALERAGFIVYKVNEGGKSFYQIKYSYNLKPVVIYPKKIDDRLNPPANFMAVIVCQNAAQNLPVVKGTYNRLELTFNDPLGYEGLDESKEEYDKTCRQIALEMFYLFSKLKHMDS